jgi:hypothetical protein
LFPFLWCTSTTTLSLSGAYTVTATSTVGSVRNYIHSCDVAIAC